MPEPTTRPPRSRAVALIVALGLGLGYAADVAGLVSFSFDKNLPDLVEHVKGWFDPNPPQALPGPTSTPTPTSTSASGAPTGTKSPTTSVASHASSSISSRSTRSTTPASVHTTKASVKAAAVSGELDGAIDPWTVGAGTATRSITMTVSNLSPGGKVTWSYTLDNIARGSHDCPVLPSGWTWCGALVAQGTATANSSGRITLHYTWSRAKVQGVIDAHPDDNGAGMSGAGHSFNFVDEKTFDRSRPATNERIIGLGLTVDE